MDGYVAVLFGGPLDGDELQVSTFAPTIKFPVRKSQAQMAKEGESLASVYEKEIYDRVMSLGKYECLYLYRQK